MSKSRRKIFKGKKNFCSWKRRFRYGHCVCWECVDSREMKLRWIANKQKIQKDKNE